MFFFVTFVSLWFNRQLFCVADALRSVVLSDNAVEDYEIKTRRVAAEGSYWGLSASIGLNNEYEDHDEYTEEPYQTSRSPGTPPCSRLFSGRA